MTKPKKPKTPEPHLGDLSTTPVGSPHRERWPSGSPGRNADDDLPTNSSSTAFDRICAGRQDEPAKDTSLD